ncbi:MAG: tripartite tricarboxylate transporter substrate-binding protein [Rhodospirillaceae bacterium]
MNHMSGALRPVLIGLSGAAAIASSALADNVADFYKGKTVTLTMGTSPGGSYQVYGQLFTDHMPQYIPGKPTVVLGFMPGAGGVKAANYLYNAAAQDGSQLLLSHAITISEKLQPQGVKFESAKFQWLGSFDAIGQVLVTWHTAPVKTLEDAREKQAVIGAFSKSHLTYQWASLANSLLGAKFRIVPGFSSGAKNNLAMEQGETHGWTPSVANLVATKPDWLKTKKLNLLVTYTLERMPEIPQVPTLVELAKPADKDVAEFVIAGTPIARSIAAGPGVPTDRVAALRTAFEKTVADAGFLADAKKRKLSISPRKWQQTEALVKRIVSASPELVQRVKKATGQTE